MGRRDKRRARARRRKRRETAPRKRAYRPRMDGAKAALLLALKRDPAARLLARFAEDDAVRSLLEPLAEVAAARAPKILDDPQLGVPLVRLASHRAKWIRPLGKWRPRGRSRHGQMRSLIDHLLVRFAPPPFLYYAFESPRGQDVDLFIHTATGGSLRGAVEAGLLPPSVTRAMWHALSCCTDRLTAVEAVRCVQVEGFGGTSEVARALLDTFLGDRWVDDRFWSDVVRFVCRGGAGPSHRLSRVLTFIQEARSRDPALRSDFATLRRLVREFLEAAVEVAAGPTQAPYRPSGFLPGEWTSTEDEAGVPVEEVWTLTEILEPTELRREGAVLRHCVASYHRVLRGGGTSIWSLRRNGRRRVTIEVVNRTRRIVQVKGRSNRSPRGREAALVAKWAKQNSLHKLA